MSAGPSNNKESSLASVEYYLSVLAHKIQMLRMQVEEISQQDYTSPSPLALSEILIRILSRYFDELKSLSNKIDYQASEDIVRTARTINFVVEGIFPQLLEAIETANTDSPIASVNEAYEYIARQVRYGTNVIIYPKWEYNASYYDLMTILRRITESLDPQSNRAIFRGAPPKFAVITYPKVENRSILRQALMAHEVGHFINEAVGWSNSLFEKQLFDPDDHDNIVNFITAQPDINQVRTINEIIAFIEEAIAPWILEIIADLLAVCVLGPAYLITFDEVIFLPDFLADQKIYRSHPPEQLRKHLMGGVIKDLHLDPVLHPAIRKDLSEKEKDLFNKIYQWVDVISKNPDDEQFKAIEDLEDIPSEVIRFAFQILRKAVEKALLLLRTNYFPTIKEASWFCKPRDVVDGLRLQELLAYGFTPTELYVDPSRDPSFAAIMNSGWFHLIQNAEMFLYFSNKRPQSINPDSVRADYINLQNLIAKSIESLMFKREFNRRKGAGNG